MHPYVNIAIKAARRAGDLIMRATERLDAIQVREKGRNNYVTEIDQQAERLIIDTIRQAYPQHSILAEESGYLAGELQDTVWVIDPLDGTTNFMHGFPHFAISIAVKYKNTLEHAVVYDPVRFEIFSATRGQGAQLNGRRLRVTQQYKLEKCLLGTGFPFRNLDPKLQQYLSLFNSFYPLTAGLRRGGAATLDLAYVAAGRLDGYWEMGLSEWDIAAGALLITEAGGIVNDFNGENNFLQSGNIIAANPKIFHAISEIIRNTLVA